MLAWQVSAITGAEELTEDRLPCQLATDPTVSEERTSDALLSLTHISHIYALNDQWALPLVGVRFSVKK